MAGFCIDHQADHDFPRWKIRCVLARDARFRACLLIVRLHAAFLHIRDHTVQECLHLPQAQVTSSVVDDAVRPARIETGDDPSVSVFSDRKLCFIPVVKRLVHADDGLHRRGFSKPPIRFK